MRLSEKPSEPIPSGEGGMSNESWSGENTTS
jgi:hypothetical protein